MDVAELKRYTKLDWERHTLYLNTEYKSIPEIVAMEIGGDTLTLPELYDHSLIYTCHFQVLKNAAQLRHLIIGANYTQLDLHNDTFPNLETLTVVPYNETYSSWHDMLFSSGGEKLELILGYYRDASFTVPAGVKKLGEYALEGALCTQLHLPETIDCSAHTFDRMPLIDRQRPIAMVGDFFCKLMQPIQRLELPPYTRRYSSGCFACYTPEEVCAPRCFQAHTTTGIRSFTITDPHAAIRPELLDSWCDLQYIQVPPDHDSCLSIEGVLFKKDGTLLFYPRGRTQSQYEVPAFATAIAMGAFHGCRYLRSIALPDSVSTIGAQAFRNCILLQSVSLGPQVTEIGERAFCECACLTEVWIHSETQLHIGAYAFSGCRMLSIVHFPEKLALTLDEYVFAGNHALAEIDLPEGLTRISPYCFYESALPTLTLPASVAVIDTGAFSSSELCEFIIAPRTQALQIGDKAFHYCKKLCAVHFPPQFPLTLGESAFSYCECLTDLQLPCGTTHIGACCLYVSGIQALTIPHTVETLGPNSLQGIHTVTVWEHSAKGLMRALAYVRPEKKTLHIRQAIDSQKSGPEMIAETGYTLRIATGMPTSFAAQLWDDGQLNVDAYIQCLKRLTYFVTRQNLALEYLHQGQAVPAQILDFCRQYLRHCNYAAAKRLLDEGRAEDIRLMLQEGLITESSARRLLDEAGDTVVAAYLLEFIGSRRKRHGTLPL